MKFEEIELGSYLVSANKSFLYYVYEKDYIKKTFKVEVLDAKRPLLKFVDTHRFKEYNYYQTNMFEKYIPIIKPIEKMNREQLSAKILEILTETEVNTSSGNYLSQKSSVNLFNKIINLIPKTSLEQVEEFMITAKQPVHNQLGELEVDRRLFRIKLIQEELNEFSDSLTDEERADALGDMQYVLDGLVIEMGLKDKKDEIFSEIHRSNMSKFDKTIDEAELTYNKYQKEEIETYSELVGENLVTYRSEDNKVLKSCNYSPPNLKPYLI